MTTALDSILSGKGDSAPAPAATEQETTPVQATTETPEAPPQENNEPTETDVGGQKMVPKAALDEARGKAKRYTEQVASFETTVSELRRQNDGLSRQVSELLHRIPVPQQAKDSEPLPDIFADPDGHLNARLSPFETRLNTVSQTLTLRASRAENIAAHGREAVTKMEQAIGDAMATGDPEMAQLRAAMLQSDDPVGIAMSWYQRRSVLQEVGSDPAAYREKLKAEILAELQQGNAAQATQPAAQVMPSNLAGARNVGNRSGPAWAGPTPLTDIFKR